MTDDNEDNPWDTVDKIFEFSLRYEQEGKPTPEVVEVAKSISSDEDEYWGIICALRHRSTDDDFNYVKSLIQSSIDKEREIGADILGIFGSPKPIRHDECVDLLVPLLDDLSSDVVDAALMSLGHLSDIKAMDKVLTFINDPDPGRRQSVSHAIGSLEDQRAINSLIILTRDENRDVRNWATFHLGFYSSEHEAFKNKNTPEVQQALLDRTTEEDEEIRGEAILGLASRKHPLARELILKELQTDEIMTYAFEAAEELGDTTLIPALEAYRARHTPEQLSGYYVDCLGNAIKALKEQEEIQKK
ncbi:HEAT repeat domain-containing protein [bacterium]|nr:HEAT repeat domain-containing protein [bacterium]